MRDLQKRQLGVQGFSAERNATEVAATTREKFFARIDYTAVFDWLHGKFTEAYEAMCLAKEAEKKG
ncbi:hypothetical protein KR52_07720 [Synechococcus sp. KORDI-52]|uniref:hypothetical protein n=1 Tax=Synechococcus sp. KORDI-52 TaxID=585425 RepID=UPI0004E090CD|nr:hypothetical protein [Synechococcus sp. KORDI-52]AII49028.1 hypothetical protein KR52_07720 [Synechococcus sp. KORDI-52]